MLTPNREPSLHHLLSDWRYSSAIVIPLTMDQTQPAQPFQPYLFENERVVWTGQPKQGISLSGKDVLLIPFSLMWGGFVIFWNVGVWGGLGDDQAAPVFLRLWGIPFLLVGLYFIFGRFLHDAYIRKHLRYAVTDQRILVLRRAKFTSLDIHRLPKLELFEHRGQTGTLRFEADSSGPWSGMNGLNWWLPSLGSAAQFFCIDKARRVYELIQNQLRA
jgi:hypothetical protein